MGGQDHRGLRAALGTPRVRRPDFAGDDAEPEETFAAWWAECAHSRSIVDAAGSLDDLGHDGATGE
jgi:hypothetical protein